MLLSQICHIDNFWTPSIFRHRLLLTLIKSVRVSDGNVPTAKKAIVQAVVVQKMVYTEVNRHVSSVIALCVFICQVHFA